MKTYLTRLLGRDALPVYGGVARAICAEAVSVAGSPAASSAAESGRWIA